MCVRVSVCVCVAVTAFGLAWVRVCLSKYVCADCTVVFLLGYLCMSVGDRCLFQGTLRCDCE